MRGTTAAVIVAMIMAASVTPARSVQAEPGFEVVPGEFLVRNPGVVTSDMEALSNGWYLIDDATGGFTTSRAAALSRHLDALVIPNRIVELTGDPMFPDQWALENTGQTGGTVDADIDADAAWGFTRGDPSVVIAIIDTGVDLDHPDLAGRLWVNPGEIPGNGIDDDQNGYIDDVNGWDFSASDDSPNDEYGHGTAVAGMAAASLNGVGTVGIAPQTTIMPLRACSPGCPISTLVAAVAYARNNGADIINLSLGGSGPYFDPLRDELTAGPDVLVTAAAGNSAANSDPNPFFPAGFDLPNILSVASTDDFDQLSDFSNYGPVTVDLAAPGDNVLTTSIGGWANASGTSFSAPLVAGVAGLVLSIRPGRPPEEVIDLILAGVDSLPSLTGKTKTGGRLNAGATVFAATGPVANISTSSTDATVPATVTLDGSGSYDPLGSITRFSWSVDDKVISTATTIKVEVLDSDPHVVTLDLVDDDGLTGTANLILDLNGRPTIDVKVSPTLGVAPLALALAATTVDPDGDSLTVTWRADGYPIDRVGSQLFERGVHVVKAFVDDGVAAVSSDPVNVFVGTNFTDTELSVFVMDVAWASATGLTSGCAPTQFCPGRPITRGEAAAFLRRWLKLGDGPDSFSDDDNHRFEADINALAAAGITFGCGPRRFCPDDPLSRGQWAALLRRSLDLAPGTDRFVDDDGSSFEADIDALAASGLTRGCNPPTNDRFCSTRSVNRAEAVAMLHRGDHLR